MMRRKNSPGCKCCGCVADANHVCRCGCIAPFPKEFFTDVGLGPVTLTWDPATSLWKATSLVPGTQSYTSPTIGVSCTPYSIFTMEVRYSLASCVGAAGSLKWRFSLQFPVNICNDIERRCQKTTYGDPTWFQTVYTSVNADIPFTCDYSLLTFSLPSVINNGGGLNCPEGLAVPGGGGVVTVVP